MFLNLMKCKLIAPQSDLICLSHCSVSSTDSGFINLYQVHIKLTGTIYFSVRQAQLVGPQAFSINAYVTLKLQDVKSVTQPIKGPHPCWEQDFLL